MSPPLAAMWNKVSHSVVRNTSRSPAPLLHLPPWHFFLPFSRMMLGHFGSCSLPKMQNPLILAVLLISVTRLFERLSANSFAPQPPNRPGTDWLSRSWSSFLQSQTHPLTAGWHCWVRRWPGCSGVYQQLLLRAPDLILQLGRFRKAQLHIQHI